MLKIKKQQIEKVGYETQWHIPTDLKGLYISRLKNTQQQFDTGWQVYHNGKMIVSFQDDKKSCLNFVKNFQQY